MLPEFAILHDNVNGYWLPLSLYEPWFVAAVILWGVAMASGGVYCFFRPKMLEKAVSTDAV